MSDAADDGQAAGGGSGSGRSSTASTRQTSLLPIVSGSADREGSTRSKNSKAAKLRFPADVPTDVKDAILNFTPPAHLLIADIPQDGSTPSVSAFYGVRLDIKPNEGEKLATTRKQKYMCLANQKCRTARNLLSISTTSTTGATNHLKSQHSIQSAASLLQQESKEAANDSVESVKQSKIFKSDPKRWNALSIVKSFVIQHAIPFSMFEDPRVRHTLSVLVPGDKIDVEALHNKAVKKHVVELYLATIRAVTADLLKEIRAALLPIVFINTDLWTSKVSGDKYIGVRIFFIDSKGILQTMLLAVKLFRPDPSLGKVTGKVVFMWLVQVLAQNGLRQSNVAGAVTDAGADVRTGVGDAFDREWCGPHMANRATIDGTGMSPTKEASKNPRCRELLELCKRVVEFVNRSSSFKIQLEDVIEEATDGKGSKAKLTQAVLQRWISICLMLLRLLQRWDALRTVYLNRNMTFPLAGKRQQVEEVYSIVKVVSDDILYCQRTSEPTAQWALENLVILLTDTLEPSKPLEVRHVTPIGGDDSGPSSTLRSHEDLTEIGRQTRDSFRVAFAKRFLPRYGAGLAGRSHLFDRTMLLSPSARKMKYIDQVLGSTAAIGMALSTAAQIKAKVKTEVTSLLVNAIIAKRARDKKTKDTVDVDDPPAAKRPRSAGRGGTAGAASTVTDRRRRTAGLMDDSDDELNTDSPVERDAHEEADAILQAWLTLQIPNEHKEENGAEYWRLHGKEQPEVLRAVAQNVFGVPASAGVMERDFCVADYFLPRKRGSLDPGNLEMCLYLRAQFDRIPLDIPKLSDEAAQAAIPERFKDPALLREVAILDYEVADQPADDVDPEGPEWVLRDGDESAEEQDGGEQQADASDLV